MRDDELRARETRCRSLIEHDTEFCRYFSRSLSALSLAQGGMPGMGGMVICARKRALAQGSAQKRERYLQALSSRAFSLSFTCLLSPFVCRAAWTWLP